MMKKLPVISILAASIILVHAISAQTPVPENQQKTNPTKLRMTPRTDSPIEFGYGGSDTYGYEWIDSDESGGPTFNWIDITTTGSDAGIHSDDGSALVDIGFSFQFYGNTYSQIYVGENGILSFDASGVDEYNNQSIPNGASPNNLIAAFWDDQITSSTGTIYYETRGTAPNRQFIVEWYQVPRINDAGSDLTYEIILSESDNSILFQYATMNSSYGDGSSATLGIENSDASEGLEISYNSSYVYDGLAVRISVENTGSLYVRGFGTAMASDEEPANTLANPTAYQITGYNTTVEAWVYLMDLPGNPGGYRIVTRPYPNDPFHAYTLYVNNFGTSDSPRFGFGISDGTNRISALDPSPPVTGSWVHLAGTYDGSSVNLYVNVTLVASQSFFQSIGAGADGFYVGSRYTFDPTQGLIDEVRLWNVTRSQAEIQNNMRISLQGTEPGLAGYWAINEAVPHNSDHWKIEDQTANHNDLVLFNQASIVDDPAESTVEILPEIVTESLEAVVGEQFSHTPAVFGWPTPSISLATPTPGGMSISGSSPGDSVTWIPADFQNEWNEFALQADNSVGTVKDTFEVWVGLYPVQISEHNNNLTRLSVFNNGAIGNMEDTSGVGFLYNGVNGLYEGDLVIGQSIDQVSGGLFIREFGTSGGNRTITSDLQGFGQAFETQFYDGRAADPIGVTVKQQSHSKSTSPDESFVIVEYTIINTGSADLTDIYAGLAMDWDIGSDPSQNLAGYDSANRLSYMYDATGGITNHYGTVALSGAVSGHRIWLRDVEPDNEDAALYSGMTSYDPIPSTAGDMRELLATGPYDIPAGDSVFAAFALVGGSDLASIQINAGNAINAYQSVPPGPPQNFSALPGNNQVTLSWDPNSEPDLRKYGIYRRTSTSSTFLIAEITGSPPDTFYVDTGVINETTYYYQITAVDSLDNESAFSEEISATPFDVTIPPVVAALYPTSGGVLNMADYILVKFDRSMDLTNLTDKVIVQGSRSESVLFSTVDLDSILAIVPDSRFFALEQVEV
ncbi:MAG TPA: LamG-like jellyroll fold domain-containing protein, partial [bacterium]|nr:LamG-like jellyroll fold domain-containing protein [bacterium]